MGQMIIQLPEDETDAGRTCNYLKQPMWHMRRCAKMQFDSTTINMLIKELGTFYMVLLSSALSYIIGIPLGIALVVTDKDGISPVPVFNRVLGVVINLLRSVPFIILLIMVIPITRLIVGRYGSTQPLSHW